ncbi:MAG TPA: nucleotidyl transferase AbiEii/AbiGii toxin family protein [Thermoanaerobaculia bacterium]
MRARTFWKTVVADRADFLEELIGLLESHAVSYCVVGGQGVNAYVDPVVSLDLDLAIAAREAPRLESLLREHFRVESFPHSLNVSQTGSDLRVQIQTDPRYAEFVDRAERRDVLGLTLPVARVEDVLQGKIWAAGDRARRPSKRQKDLADIARLLESYPRLRDVVPEEILARLI